MCEPKCSRYMDVWCEVACLWFPPPSFHPSPPLHCSTAIAGHTHTDMTSSCCCMHMHTNNNNNNINNKTPYHFLLSAQHAMQVICLQLSHQPSLQ